MIVGEAASLIFGHQLSKLAFAAIVARLGENICPVPSIMFRHQVKEGRPKRSIGAHPSLFVQSMQIRVNVTRDANCSSIGHTTLTVKYARVYIYTEAT